MNGQTGINADDVELEDATAFTDCTVQMNWIFLGLHFVCTSNGNTDTQTFQRIITVTGTSSEGVTVNLTQTIIWDRSTNTRTLTLVGTLVVNGNTYNLNISRQITVNGTVRTLTINSTITKNGVTIYSKQITRSVDMSTAPPRVHTVNGTVSVHNANTPTTFVTITYNSVQYICNAQQQYRVFQAGTATLTDGAGNTAQLTVQNGTLTGPLVNPQGTTIGTVTIGKGTVTITPSA